MQLAGILGPNPLQAPKAATADATTGPNQSPGARGDGASLAAVRPWNARSLPSGRVADVAGKGGEPSEQRVTATGGGENRIS